MAKRTCSVDGCSMEHLARGFCPNHYYAWQRTRTNAICIAEGCSNAVRARGLCPKHYGRLLRWGSVEDRPRASRPLSERFWSKVEKTDSCWLWRGAAAGGGYGHLLVDGRFVQAHRYAYETLIGPIPEGLELDHLCRVRRCVRPEHLEPVTRGENIRRGYASRRIEREA